MYRWRVSNGRRRRSSMTRVLSHRTPGKIAPRLGGSVQECQPIKVGYLFAKPEDTMHLTIAMTLAVCTMSGGCSVSKFQALLDSCSRPHPDIVGNGCAAWNPEVQKVPPPMEDPEAVATHSKLGQEKMARIYIYIYIYICMNMYVYVCIYIYIHISTHVHIYIYIYIFILLYHRCVYICIYIYTHLHIQTHIATHIHTRMDNVGSFRTTASSQRAVKNFKRVRKTNTQSIDVYAE